MIPQVEWDVLKIELEQHIRRSELSRQLKQSRVADVRGATRLRWAFGSALLRLGAVILGEDGLDADHVSGR